MYVTVCTCFPVCVQRKMELLLNKRLRGKGSSTNLCRSGLIHSVDCLKSEKCGVLFHEPGIVDWTSSILKRGRNTWLTHMYILHVTNFWLVGNLNEYIKQTTAQTKFNIWKPYPIKGHIYCICHSDMHTFGSWSVLWCLCTVLVWSTGVMNMCAVTVISNQHFTHSCCM